MVVVNVPVAPLPLKTSHLGVRVTPTLNCPAAVAAMDDDAQLQATTTRPNAYFRIMVNFLCKCGCTPFAHPLTKVMYFNQVRLLLVSHSHLSLFFSSHPHLTGMAGFRKTVIVYGVATSARATKAITCHTRSSTAEHAKTSH